MYMFIFLFKWWKGGYFVYIKELQKASKKKDVFWSDHLLCDIEVA